MKSHLHTRSFMNEFNYFKPASFEERLKLFGVASASKRNRLNQKNKQVLALDDYFLFQLVQILLLFIFRFLTLDGLAIGGFPPFPGK